MTELSAFKYRVFLSYSHRDKAWGRWLQAALEGYPIDGNMVGRETPAGPVPKTLRPIYRDREGGGDRLPSDRTLAALQASQYLVVLCSPSAAKSRRINEEIRRFTALGRADRVIPVIVDGEPGDPGRECFAPALRFKLAPNRPLTDRRGEPAVAEARLDRDGKARVKHKVAAAVLCLGPDEVARRARAVRRRRLRIRCSGIVAALLALTLACDGGLAWTRHRLSRDEMQLDRTMERAVALTGRAVTASRQFGLPRGVSTRILDEAEGVFRGVAGLGRDTPRLRMRKASALIEFAGMHAALGGADVTGARLIEAERLMQGLAAEAAGNPAWRSELVQLYDRLGEALQARGSLEQAVASYRAGLAIAERLASDPGNIDRQHDLVLRHLKVGDASRDLGALGAALASYHASLVVAEYLAAVAPGRARWQHALLLAHRRVGDALRLRGELDAALVHYHESRAVAGRLVAGDPGNTEWRGDLSASHVGVGDVLALQGRLDEALASYRAGNALAGRLAAAEPGDPRRQRDLGVSHERMGAALEAHGDIDAALAEHQASLAIARRVVAADPDHAGWQRDLGIAHQHVGDLLRSRGDLAAALTHYRASRAIVARLAAADPGHAGRRYDLGASHARMGLVLEAREDFAAALREYEACLGIVGWFADADPDDVGSRRDLAVSYGRLAAVLHRLGKSGQALAELRKGREIMAALRRRAPDIEQWRQDLDHFDGRIAALEGRAPVTAASVPALRPPVMASAAGSLYASSTEGRRMPVALGLPPKL